MMRTLLMSLRSKSDLSSVAWFKQIHAFPICGLQCVAVELPVEDAVQAAYLSSNKGLMSVPRRELIEAATRNSTLSRNSFLGGRWALRLSIQEDAKIRLAPMVNIEVSAILTNEHGAPVLADPIKGSVSHKDNIAVGLGSYYFDGHIGVDIECYSCNERGAVLSPARRILTEAETTRLGVLTDFSAEQEVYLRFSLKESLYKALHPAALRFIGLREVEVDPADDGSAAFRFPGGKNILLQEAPLISSKVLKESKMGDIGTDKQRWYVGTLDNKMWFAYCASWVKLCGRYCITAVKLVPLRGSAFECGAA